MKNIIVYIHALTTAITLIHGTHIIAAQEQYQSTLLSKENAQIIGNYAISGVTKYLGQDPRLTGVIIYLESLIIPDPAVKTAVSEVISDIKNRETLMATQMLGVLLKDLNTAYGTDFKIDEVITKMLNPTPAGSAQSSFSSTQEPNIEPLAPNQNIQPWLTKIWENIKHFINQGYQQGKDIIARQWYKSRR